jgi:hypothetical protein
MAAALLKMRNTVRLKQYLDEGMATQFRVGRRMRQSMLARLDLTKL